MGMSTPHLTRIDFLIRLNLMKRLGGGNFPFPVNGTRLYPGQKKNNKKIVNRKI